MNHSSNGLLEKNELFTAFSTQTTISLFISKIFQENFSKTLLFLKL